MQPWLEMNPVSQALWASSLVLTTLFLERLLYWAREARLARSQDLKAEAEGATPSASTGSSPGLALRVFRRLRRPEGFCKAALLPALELERQRARRGMVLAEVLISAAPVLGILGTVLGLMESFQGVQAGHRDAEMVMGGLSTALETTALGLSISLMALYPFHWIEAHTERVLAEAEEEILLEAEGLTSVGEED